MCLMAYFTYVIIDQQKEIDARLRELETIREKIAQQEELREQLEEEKAKIESDEHYEQLAREKLGMVKSGEKVFVDIGE